jgi:hypothetical protein
MNQETEDQLFTFYEYKKLLETIRNAVNIEKIDLPKIYLSNIIEINQYVDLIAKI